MLSGAHLLRSMLADAHQRFRCYRKVWRVGTITILATLIFSIGFTVAAQENAHATTPAKTGRPDLDTASDLGTISTDNNTADDTPTFTVSSLEVGNVVTLTALLGSSEYTCSFTATSSSGSCTFDPLPNGTYYVTAVQSGGGVNSDKSESLPVIINKTTISTPATPDLHADSDTGISNTDNLSKDNTPTISVSGTFTGTATVTAAKTGSTSVTCNVSSNSCTLGTLSDGDWSITVKDQDTAGNSATSSALSITINATASAPSVGSLGICSWPGCVDPIQVGNYMEAFTPHLSLGSPSAALTYKWYQCTPSPETLLDGETNSRLYIDEQKVGKSFKVEITATNFEGSSSSSTNCYSILSHPGAPTSLVAASGNGSATISFSAPSYVGNGIISYLYSTDGKNYVDLSSSSSPVTISGLTNGTTYSIRLKAKNSTGNSLASSAISVTPASVPAAPTVGVATATGPDSASVAFTAPTSNG
jgi:titin